MKANVSVVCWLSVAVRGSFLQSSYLSSDSDEGGHEDTHAPHMRHPDYVPYTRAGRHGHGGHAGSTNSPSMNRPRARAKVSMHADACVCAGERERERERARARARGVKAHSVMERGGTHAHTNARRTHLCSRYVSAIKSCMVKVVQCVLWGITSVHFLRAACANGLVALFVVVCLRICVYVCVCMCGGGGV